jgi:hypothetical protein
MTQFALDVSRMIEKAKKDAEKVSAQIIMDVHAAVVLKTPVDTGRARANWFTTIGAPSSYSTSDADPSAMEEDLHSVLASFRIGDDVYIVNNLPYINVLEYGLFPNPPKAGTGKTVGGFSTQAPAGMVRVTVSEFQDIVNKAMQP